MMRFRLGRCMCFLLAVTYFIMLRMLSKSFDASVRKERIQTALETAIPVRKFIREINEEQTIKNEWLFGPVEPDTLIIVVQVHDRLDYLENLVASLSRARHISTALLVLSHDLFHAHIHEVVDTIQFTKGFTASHFINCPNRSLLQYAIETIKETKPDVLENLHDKIAPLPALLLRVILTNLITFQVMQIYYPYSKQAFPTQFPGPETRLCPEGATCSTVRNSRLTQIKHHWWWKANMVFNHLTCTANHTGMVLFLEDDNYVTEDFIHMLRLMRKTADRRCPHCEIFSLCPFSKTYTSHIIKGDQAGGSITGLRDLMVPMVKKNAINLQRLDDYYEDQINAIPTGTDFTRVVKTVWFSKIQNMGFAFNRTVWQSILAIHDEFCKYNDYNWDFSLLNLSRKRLGSGSFNVLMCKGARVVHMGKCGIHHQQPDCDQSKIIAMVQNTLRKVRNYMYPKRLLVSVDKSELVLYDNVRRGNGGWLDQRDHELCKNMTRMERAKQTSQQ